MTEKGIVEKGTGREEKTKKARQGCGRQQEQGRKESPCLQWWGGQAGTAHTNTMSNACRLHPPVVG